MFGRRRNEQSWTGSPPMRFYRDQVVTESGNVRGNCEREHVYTFQITHKKSLRTIRVTFEFSLWPHKNISTGSNQSVPVSEGVVIAFVPLDHFSWVIGNGQRYYFLLASGFPVIIILMERFQPAFLSSVLQEYYLFIND